MEDSYLAKERARLQTRKLNTTVTSTGSVHSFDPNEAIRYVATINRMGIDSPLIPLADTDALFQALSQGRFLCLLLNACQPDAVPEFLLKKSASREKSSSADPFVNGELINLFLSCAENAEIKLPYVSASDFSADTNANHHILLATTWQLVRRHMRNALKLIVGSPDQDASPEALILDWAIDRLKNVGIEDVESMSDLAAGKNLIALLHSIDPASITENVGDDAESRANAAIQWAESHGITGASANDLSGENNRLLVSFLADVMQNTRAIEENIVPEPEEGVVYAVRQHWHPLGEASSSNVICAFKTETEGIRYALLENIVLIGTEEGLDLPTMIASYADRMGFTVRSVEESIGTISDLVTNSGGDVVVLRESADGFISQLPTMHLKTYFNNLLPIQQAYDSAKFYAVDRVQIY